MPHDFAPLRAFLPTDELKALLDAEVEAMGGQPPEYQLSFPSLRQCIARTCETGANASDFFRLPAAEFGPLGPWVQAFHAVRLAQSGIYGFYCKDSCTHLATHGEWGPLAAIAASESTKARANAYARLDATKVPIELLVKGIYDSSSAVRASAVAAIAKVPEKARPVLQATVATLKGKSKKLAEEALSNLTPAQAPADGELLEKLIAAWGETRNPEVAELVEKLGAMVPCPALKGRTAKEKEVEWHIRAKARDAASLTTLLAAPWPAQWRDGQKRLSALKGRKDPRIASAYMAAIEHPPYDSQASLVFRRALMNDLAALADRRQLEPLKRARPALEKQLTGYLYLSDLRSAVDGTALQAAIDALPVKPFADPELLAKAKALTAGSGKRERTEQELLHQIWSAPHDDDLKRVYADWLLERGDGRGEFIALQLGPRSEASLKRERQLLKELEPRLLGTLEHRVNREGRVFERGFLAQATCDWRAFSQGMAEPGWATVRTLSFIKGGDGEGLAKFLELPGGQSLRALHGISPSHLVPLRESAIEELGIDLMWTGDLADVVGFPRLTRVGIVAPRSKALGLLLTRPSWQRIKHFAVNTLTPLGEWLERFEKSPWLESLTLLATETELVTQPRGWRIKLERGPCATVELLTGGRDWAEPLTELEGVLPRLQRLAVLPSRSLSNKADWESALAAMAARVSPRST